MAAFDTLDGSDAFVHPDAMAAVAASGKRAERAALDDVTETIETGVRRRDSSEVTDGDLFGRVVDAWSPESSETPVSSVSMNARIRGISLDVALIHIASMSNLMAALGWAMVDLIEHSAELDAVVGGDGELAQHCALESTRMAQRSIMSRAVLSPVDLDTGEVTYAVPPGWTIATLLPLLNTSAAPGLQYWRPDRWHRHRLADTGTLPNPMPVTAFGHGRHSCPARSYEMTAGWTTHPRAIPAQIGGVARAADPCPVDYLAR